MRNFDEVFNKLSGLKVSHLLPSDNIEDDTDFDYNFQQALIETKIDVNIKGDNSFDINIDFDREIYSLLTTQIRQAIEQSFRYAVVDVIILRNLNTDKFNNYSIKTQIDLFKLEIFYSAFSSLRDKLIIMRQMRRTETVFHANSIETLKVSLAKATKISYTPNFIEDDEENDEYESDVIEAPRLLPLSKEEFKRLFGLHLQKQKKPNVETNSPQVPDVSIYDVTSLFNKIVFSNNYQLNKLIQESFLNIKVIINTFVSESDETFLEIGVDSDELDSALLPDVDTIKWLRNQFEFLRDEVLIAARGKLDVANTIENGKLRALSMKVIIEDFIYQNSTYLSYILIHNLYKEIKAGKAPNKYFSINEAGDDSFYYKDKIDNIFKSVKRG